MSIQQCLEKILEDHGNVEMIFISDPTGDKFVYGSLINQFEIPETADSHERTTVQDLLDRLDFDCYNGQASQELTWGLSILKESVS